jgi:hypothetical protein
MTTFLALFEANDELTAIFYIAAVVAFALALVSAPAAKAVPGGSLGLVALGLGLWLWPLMWTTVSAAF